MALLRFRFRATARNLDSVGFTCLGSSWFLKKPKHEMPWKVPQNIWPPLFKRGMLTLQTYGARASSTFYFNFLEGLNNADGKSLYRCHGAFSLVSPQEQRPPSESLAERIGSGSFHFWSVDFLGGLEGDGTGLYHIQFFFVVTCHSTDVRKWLQITCKWLNCWLPNNIAGDGLPSTLHLVVSRFKITLSLYSHN